MYNKRSVAVVADELSGFLNALGKNQQQYLSLWSGKPLSIDRKTIAMVRIREPFLSIIGTLQTGIVTSVLAKRNKSENGFIDRFLFVNTKNIQSNKWKPKAEGNNAAEQWEKILNRLIALPLELDDHGNIAPRLIRFTEDAEKALLEYQNNPPSYDTELDNPAITRITKKMDIYILRLCIPIQLLRWACDEAVCDTVDIETVRSAILVTDFFKRHAFALWEDIAKKNPLDKLTEQQLKIYQSLSITFKTGTGVILARKQDMAERTFKNWIKNPTLFKRIGHGA